MGEALETTTDKFVGAFARPRDLGRPFRADRFQSDFVIGENARPAFAAPRIFRRLQGLNSTSAASIANVNIELNTICDPAIIRPEFSRYPWVR